MHFQEKICGKAFLRKKVPKSGHADEHRTSPTTATLRPTTPKRASDNERALKSGIQGAKPPALFPPAFSRESLDPPPGTGRETTSQVLTCATPEAPPADPAAAPNIPNDTRPPGPATRRFFPCISSLAASPPPRGSRPQASTAALRITSPPPSRRRRIWP